MRNLAYLALGVVAIGGVFAGTGSAQVLFQDGFENEPVSAPDGSDVIGAPDIGQSWTEGVATLSGAHGVDILGSPALGTRSMRVLREGVPPLGPSNGNIDGISLPGAIFDGSIVEVEWSNRLTTEGAVQHRFNSPMQMSIGHAGSNYDNDMAFILIGDADSGSYAYTNSAVQYGNITSSAVQASLDAWDTLRAVMSFSQVNATTMGGTYDLYVSIGGGLEQQIANDALLGETTIPGVDPTSMQLRIGKGPSTAWIYYDDISITVIPEPSVVALGALAMGLLPLRRR